MKPIAPVVSVLVALMLTSGLLACRGLGGASQPSLAPQTPSSRPLNPDQEINDRHVERILQEIAGREDEPAEKVFENVQLPWLKTVPAGRFLRIMNAGYSRALGVACTHCHLEEDFSSDDKRPKMAAREMAVMHRMINEQLATMQHIEMENRFINCSTCHRGAVDPMQ